MDCLWSPNGEMKVALLLQNNTIETYSVNTNEKNPADTKTSRLTLGGHRTDVRTLSFSSDNIAILSASGDTVKVWNRSGSGHLKQTQTLKYTLFFNLLSDKPDYAAETRMGLFTFLFNICCSFLGYLNRSSFLSQGHSASDPHHGLRVRPLLTVCAWR